ncbi:MAG: hypothetical protein AB7T63_05375 [Planctomycetota bacterium]
MAKSRDQNFEPDKSGRASPAGAASDAEALSGHGPDVWKARWPEVRKKIEATWSDLASDELEATFESRDDLLRAIQRRTGEDLDEITRRIERIERELPEAGPGGKRRA